jgi:hypothetical protein
VELLSLSGKEGKEGKADLGSRACSTLPTYHLTNRFVARYHCIYPAHPIPQAPTQLHPAGLMNGHDCADQAGPCVRG